MLDKLFKNCRTYMSEIVQVKKNVSYTEKQTKGLKEVDDHLLKENHDGLDGDSTDEEIANITKSNMPGLELKNIMDSRKADFLKRNGLVVKNNSRLENSKSRIQEQIDQNFSTTGVRLTSISTLG